MKLGKLNLKGIKDDKLRIIAKSLLDHGFMLCGSRNHLVLKSSNGAKVSISKTPSCARSWRNKIAEIRTRFGIELAV